MRGHGERSRIERSRIKQADEKLDEAMVLTSGPLERKVIALRVWRMYDVESLVRTVLDDDILTQAKDTGMLAEAVLSVDIPKDMMQALHKGPEIHTRAILNVRYQKTEGFSAWLVTHEELTHQVEHLVQTDQPCGQRVTELLEAVAHAALQEADARAVKVDRKHIQ